MPCLTIFKLKFVPHVCLMLCIMSMLVYVLHSSGLFRCNFILSGEENTLIIRSVMTQKMSIPLPNSYHMFILLSINQDFVLIIFIKIQDSITLVLSPQQQTKSLPPNITLCIYLQQ